MDCAWLLTILGKNYANGSHPKFISWKTAHWKWTSECDVNINVLSSEEGTRALLSTISSTIVLNRPFSLCGDVFWSWISSASRTFRSNLRSSTFKVLTILQLNPASQNREWLENSSQVSLLIFLCCSILVDTFREVSPTYFFPQW